MKLCAFYRETPGVFVFMPEPKFRFGFSVSCTLFLVIFNFMGHGLHSFISSKYITGKGLIPSKVWDFSFCYHIQTSSGVHPASYPVGSRYFFYRGKVADHSSLFSAEVKNAWHHASVPRVSSWHGT
jgi:hypothetical protein